MALDDDLSRHWTLPAHAELRIVPVEGLYAVFNPASGNTHIVSEAARAILALVAAEALSGRQILYKLQAEFDLDAEGDPAATVAQRITELDDLGLLVPVI